MIKKTGYEEFYSLEDYKMDYELDKVPDNWYDSDPNASMSEDYYDEEMKEKESNNRTLSPEQEQEQERRANAYLDSLEAGKRRREQEETLDFLEGAIKRSKKEKEEFKKELMET